MEKKITQDCLDKIKNFYNVDIIAKEVDAFIDDYDKEFLTKALNSIIKNPEERLFTHDYKRYIYEIDFDPNLYKLHLIKTDKKFPQIKNELICNFSYFIMKYDIILNIKEANKPFTFATFVASPYVHISQFLIEDKIKFLVSQSKKNDIMECKFNFKLKKFNANYIANDKVRVDKQDVFLGDVVRCVDKNLKEKSITYSNVESYDIDVQSMHPESRDKMVSLFEEKIDGRVELLKETTSTKLINGQCPRELVSYNLEGVPKLLQIYGDITKNKNEIHYIREQNKDLKFNINFTKIKNQDIFEVQM